MPIRECGKKTEILVCPDVKEALNRLFRIHGEHDLTLIAGSLYLAGEVRSVSGTQAEKSDNGCRGRYESGSRSGGLVHGTDCSDKGETDMINFEEEIERFKPSLEVEAVSDAIVKSDLTDMADIMMDIMKDIKKEK